VTLRVVPHGATTRVLISADLMIRGTVAQYAPGAIGDVGQRLVEQFAGNVEQLLSTQAGGSAEPATPAAAGRKRPAVVVALLVAAGTLAAGLAAWVIWRRRGPAVAQLVDPAIPRYSSPEGARHG
jgi:hypothetical protein